MMAEDQRNQKKRAISRSLFAMAIVGWLIIGSSLNTLLFSAIPFKTTSPEWYLSLLGQLLSISPMILIGATLITFTAAMHPKEKLLRDWNLSLQRISSLLVLLLILVIPLQFVLGTRILNRQTADAYASINRLKGIAKTIQGLNSEAELRAYVSTLPDAPMLPAKFDAGFPTIKERAIQNIQSQVNTGITTVDNNKSQATQVFLKEAVRNTAQAILMAAAFSALANLSSKASNSLTKFFDFFL